MICACVVQWHKVLRLCFLELQEGFDFSFFCNAGKKKYCIHARTSVSVCINAGDMA